MKRIASITDNLIQEIRRDNQGKRFDHIVVMIIEDEPMVVEALSFLLKQMGCEPVIAISGEKAIQLVREGTRPHIIFLDLNLPKMDGAQTLRAIREVDIDIPVVVVTGYPNSDMMHQVMEMGYVGLVTKPLLPGNISEILTKHGFESRMNGES